MEEFFGRRLYWSFIASFVADREAADEVFAAEEEAILSEAAPDVRAAWEMAPDPEVRALCAVHLQVP